MTVFDTASIARKTDLRHIEFHETLDSTSKLAAELLAELLPLSPAMVLTEQQTAGRGRGSNAWWATQGALTFTLVLDAAQIAVPPEVRPLISLAVGIAVRRSLIPHVQSRAISIKWPNDIYIGDQKVCGILTEQRSSDGNSAILIGVGINVNNSLAQAPADVRQRAASLFDLTQVTFDLNALLIQTVQQINESILKLATSRSALLAEINEFSLLNNRVVEIETANGTCRGKCVGVDATGALVLETGDGPRAFVAGTIVGWT